MTVYLSNRDGDGKTNEEGHYRLLSKMTNGEVLMSTDLEVTESAVLGMSVDVSPGDYKIDTSSDYAYMGWIDDYETVTISTADPSNPRISTIVLYVDKGETTSASPPNNPGIAKLISVDGTASSTPTAPNNTVIQSAVGSGNPFIKLATAYIGAGVTQVTNSNITDLRTQIGIVDDVLNASNLVQFVGPLLWPVGSIYANATDNTNPGTLFGFGTWTKFAEERVLVGQSDGSTEFGAALQIYGTKTETLTENQMPSHTHVIDPPLTSTSTNGSHTHSTNRDVAYTDNSSRRTGPSNGEQAFGFGDHSLLSDAGSHSHTVNIASFTSGAKGNNQAHNNIQPSIAVYMWRRTA